jgi:hypothetical protein
MALCVARFPINDFSRFLMFPTQRHCLMAWLDCSRTAREETLHHRRGQCCRWLVRMFLCRCLDYSAGWNDDNSFYPRQMICRNGD